MKRALPWINAVGGLVCVLCIAFARYGDRIPVPVPDSPVRQCFDDYREVMSAVWSEGSEQSFDSDRAAWEWVAKRAEAARKAAFAPVHQREQDAFGGDKWDDAKRRELWRQFAEEAK